MTDTKSPTIEVQQQYAYFLLPYEVEVTVNNKTKKTHRVELVTRLLDNHFTQKNLIKLREQALARVIKELEEDDSYKDKEWKVTGIWLMNICHLGVMTEEQFNS